MNYEQQIALCRYVHAVKGLIVAVSSIAPRAVGEIIEKQEAFIATLDPLVRHDFEEEIEKDGKWQADRMAEKNALAKINKSRESK